ncbi:MAG: TrkA family potassium uptake protein [Oscillospiraceae bacterium]|nr:TrkA family potassium uptake protein [Oscillospiraceae bacterium]
MKSYAVIGLGRFGTRMATSLYAHGEDVIAVDINENLANQIADSVTKSVAGDAKNKNVMKAVGVADCDCVIVGIGSNLAASVLITMNLKSLGVPHIICKAHDDTHGEILKKLGADQVIIPEFVVADKVAGSLAVPNILEYIELSDDYGIIEYTAPASWGGKTLKELNIREKFGATVIAEKRGETVTVSPGGNHIVQSDTTLVLLGDYKSLEEIKDLK